MNDKENQVLLIGFVMIAAHFFFGGQFKVIWKVVTTSPPKPAATPGPGTTLKPFFQGLIPGAPINTPNNTTPTVPPPKVAPGTDGNGAYIGGLPVPSIV